MAKFEVEITETLRRVVEIEAADMFEAEEVAHTMWGNSEIILDEDDFEEVEFCTQREIE